MILLILRHRSHQIVTVLSGKSQNLPDFAAHIRPVYNAAHTSSHQPTSAHIREAGRFLEHHLALPFGKRTRLRARHISSDQLSSAQLCSKLNPAVKRGWLG